MMFNERNLMHVNVDYCLAMMMLEVLTCMLSLNESLMWSIYRVESCMKYVSSDMLCFHDHRGGGAGGCFALISG